MSMGYLQYPHFMLYFFQLESTICKCMDRYDNGWVGRFCQEVDVLLGIKVVLLKKICFPKKKKFSQEQIEVLIRGKGFAKT